MLPDNGRIPKERRNYFMTLKEFEQLIRYLTRHYDSKWVLYNLYQFGMGMRASEVCAINMYDFKDTFKLLTYRQAKTNKMIYNEPVPDPLRLATIEYIKLNAHRLKDGYLFPNYTGIRNKGCPIHSVETINTFWTKWRRGCAKEYKSERWLDSYKIITRKYRILSELNKGTKNQEKLAKIIGDGKKKIRNNLYDYKCRGFINEKLKLTEKGKDYIKTPRYEIRHRISSHSLRRLHRKELSKEIKNDWILAKLCHYDDMGAFLKYKDEFEVLEDSEKYLMPILNPILNNISAFAKGQTQMSNWIIMKDNSMTGIKGI